MEKGEQVIKTIQGKYIDQAQQTIYGISLLRKKLDFYKKQRLGMKIKDFLYQVQRKTHLMFRKIL